MAPKVEHSLGKTWSSTASSHRLLMYIKINMNNSSNNHVDFKSKFYTLSINQAKCLVLLSKVMMNENSLNEVGDRRLLFLLTGTFALSYLDRHILNITLSDIGEEFALSDLELGALSSVAFALIYVLLGFPVAKMSRAGLRKPIVIGALTIWSVMTVAMAAAGNYLSLFMLRIGVGVGEAGCVPPSHAMIADSFPESQRSSAFALFSAGTNFGVFLAFLVGGIVVATYGWRMAFIVAGAPGVVLAIFLAIWLREPIPSNRPAANQGRSFRRLWRGLAADRSARHTLLGMGLTATVGYGAYAWISVFLIRTHNLSATEIGIYLAFAIGVFGAIGTWAGGAVVDRLKLRNASWGLKFVALSILFVKPVSIAFYLADDVFFALVLFIIPAVTGGFFIGPSFSHIYSRIDSLDRPLATATMMFVVNLVGLGIGPLIVGGLSDGFGSLAGALIFIQVFGFWGAGHFWLAGRTINDDSPLPVDIYYDVEAQTRRRQKLWSEASRSRGCHHHVDAKS